MGESCIIFQYTMTRTGSAFSSLDVCKSMLKAGCNVEVVYSQPGPLIREYSEMGIKTVQVKQLHWLLKRSVLRKVLSVFQLVHCLIRHWWFLTQRKPDIVYSNTLLNVSPVIVAKLLGLRSVWHIRESWSQCGGEMHLPLGGQWSLRQIFRLPNKIIFVSKQQRAQFSIRHLQNKTHILYNTISPEYFERPVQPLNQRQNNRHETDFVIGIPGTLRPAKGQLMFLSVFKALLDLNPQMKLVLAGATSSEYAKEVARKATELKVSAKITFAGELSSMIGFYDNCDVVCIPSIQEPFGRVAVEAMARNRPVIAHAVGGLTEIITDGFDGVLVARGDIKAFSDAVIDMANCSEKARRLAKNAMGSAKKKFAPGVYDNLLLGVIQH